MNKKGFTMVELLTTIVILGAISVIGIVAVTKVIDSAKNNHYTTVLKNMKVAAESYFNDNRNNLPKTVGQNNKVTVKTLVDSKYLDPIKDNNNKYCDYTESLVTVYKTAISNYKYVSTLKCNNYDNRKEAVQRDLKIDISLTKPYNDKTDKVTISSSDGVRSYRYKIFKNGVLLYDSGVINQGIRDKVTIGLDYKDQVNNGTNIRAVVSATDIYGNTKQASSSVTIENNSAPICGTNIKGASTFWTNQSRTISIDCKDNNGIKCKQARYSKTFDSSIKDGYITIEGENGVNTDCLVNAYVDKIAPTLGYDLINDMTGANYHSGEWSRNGIYRHLYPKDTGGSGIYETQYSIDDGRSWYTEGNVASWKIGQTDSWQWFRVKDNAGNYSSILKLHLMIDWTPPYYTGVRAYCGDFQGNGFRGYVLLYFSDDISGLGARNASSWDSSGGVNQPYRDFGGAKSAGDCLGSADDWIGFSHIVYDKAGNQARWDDSKVGLNCGG